MPGPSTVISTASESRPGAPGAGRLLSSHLSRAWLLQGGVVVAAFSVNTLLHFAPEAWYAPARAAEFVVLIPALAILARLALRITPRGSARLRNWFRIGVVVVAISSWLLYGGWLGPSRFLLDISTTDFSLYISSARVAIEHGWSHEYDAYAYARVFHELGIRRQDPSLPGFSLYPPIVPLLVYPLAFLPLPLAHAVWYLLMALGLVLALNLVWDGRDKPALTGLLLLTPSVVFAFEVGQLAIVVCIAVGFSWWLLSRGHDIWAGLVLAIVLAKPQLGFLIPVMLLASGRWRPVVSWLGASLAVLGLAVALMSFAQVGVYAQDLNLAARSDGGFLVPSKLTLAAWLPAAALMPARLVVVGVAIVAVRRRRTIEHAIALGLVASLVTTPYIHVYDLAALFLAGLLLLRTSLSIAATAALFASFVVVNVSSLLFELAPVLPLELAWLAWLAAGPAPAAAITSLDRISAERAESAGISGG